MGLCASCGCQTAAAERFCTVCGATLAVGGPSGVALGQFVSSSGGRVSALPESFGLEPADALLAEFRDLAPRDPYSYLYAAPREQGDTSLLDPQSAAANPAPRPDNRVSRPPGPPSNTARIIVSAAFAILAAAAAAAIVTLIHSRSVAQSPALPGAPAAPGAASGQPAPSARPSAPTPGASPVGPPGTGIVAVAPGVAGQPGARAVAAFLADYFAAINGHDYPAYRNLLSAGLQRLNTPQRFQSGYRTTADSAATLDTVAASSAGRLAASVTFISHQAAADSPTRAACNRWHITLFLVPGGSGYLIGPPPPGYRASYGSCS